MKKVLLASLFIAGTVVAANAQEAAQDSTATSTTTESTATSSTSGVEQDGYASIKTDELPDAVKNSLESQDFKGWIINAASYDKKEEKYLVELKNGADTKKVKFDKEGKELKD